MASPAYSANMALPKDVSPTTTRKVFEEINEKNVDDIQMEIFYKPHTITLRKFK